MMKWKSFPFLLKFCLKAQMETHLSSFFSTVQHTFKILRSSLSFSQIKVGAQLPATQNCTRNTHLMVSAQSGLKLPCQRFSQDEGEQCQGRGLAGNNVRHSRQEWPCGLPESPCRALGEVWVPKGHRPLQMLTSKAPLAQKHAKIRSQCQPYLANKGKVGLGRIIRHEKPIHDLWTGQQMRDSTTRRQNPLTNSDLCPTSGSAPLQGWALNGSERAAVTKTFAHRASNAIETHAKIS